MTRIKKLLNLIFIFIALVIPVVASAQVFTQSQLINTPYGSNGFVVSTTTANGAKLSASSTPYFANFFAGNGTINNLTVTGSCSGCGSGGTSFGEAWSLDSTKSFLVPTTTLGIIVSASSTIGAGGQTTGLTINGGATTTGNLSLPFGTVAAPSLTFGDPGSGFYRQSSTVVGYAQQGTLWWTFAGSSFKAANGAGPSLFSSTGVSNSIPNILPDQAVTNTGFAAGIAGNINAIVGGIETVRFAAGATGFGSSTPFAQLAIHANNGSTNTTLFAIASSTASATTTLFSISNTGNVAVSGSLTATTLISNSGISINGATNLNIVGGAISFSSGPVISAPSGLGIRFGASSDSASPVAQILSVQNVSAGTSDTAGANFTINGSRSTGTGVGGSILFQTTPAAGSTGSTQNALSTALAITGNGNVGVGSTTPYGKLAISLNNNETNALAFNIASSTSNSTTTLFSVSNIGTTTLGRFGACNTTNALTTDASGNITCGVITGSGGGTVTAVTGTYPILSSGGATPVISTAFGTTTTWGMGNNGFVVTSATGVPFIAASSTLNLPNSALANSTISGVALGGTLGTLTFGTHLISGGSSYNGSAGVTITSDATNANTNSTIVARDGSGNFSAGTITAALTGNSSTATALATGRTIAITGDLAYTSPSFDGSGNVTAAGTLATVNSTPGSFGGANSIPTFTNNGKGLTTASGSVTPSIPASEITSGSFGSGNYTFPADLSITGNATSTAFFATTASTTKLWGANLQNCSGTNALTYTSGLFGCAAVPQGTITSVGGTGVVSSSGGATPNITVTGGTNGQILGWLAGVPTWTATTTFNSPLTYSAGAVSCSSCLTANQSITLSGAVTGTGSTAITTAFGTLAQGILGNPFAASTIPTALATSTLYGAASTGGFVLQWSNATGGLVLAATSSGAVFSGTAGQVDYFSGTNTAVGTSSLFIGTTGNIGIGSTTPGYLLSIFKGNNTSKNIVQIDTPTSTMPGGSAGVATVYTDSQTWTKPANLAYITVQVWGGGGGGGGGSGNGPGGGGKGGNGGTSSFTYNSGGNTVSAAGGTGGNGGTNAASGTFGAGGAASGGDTNTNGTSGTTGVAPTGGNGGAGANGGTGGTGGGSAAAGAIGNALGGGAGGAGGFSGNGGGGGSGGGAYSTKTTILASQLGATETLVVGGGGGGGGGGRDSTGTAGSNSSSGTGGNGGAGSNGSAGGSGGAPANVGGNAAGGGYGGGGGGGATSNGGLGISDGAEAGGSGGAGGKVIITAFFNATYSTATTTALSVGYITVGPNSTTTPAVGIGTSTPGATFAIQSFWGVTVELIQGFIGTINYVFSKIDQYGHRITGGPTPSVSGGTSSVVGNDNNGTITVVGTLLTSITITFANAWGTAPDCTMADSSTGVTGAVTSISTTQLVIGFSAGVNSGTVWYQCVGHQ